MNATKVIVVGIILLASIIIIWERVQENLGLGWAGSQDFAEYTDDSDYSNRYNDSSCSVAGVQLHGSLYTYYDYNSQSIDDIASSEDIIYDLELAENSPNIDVILLEIDSYGGMPVAAEEIATMLSKYVTKPVVAQIRGAGTSAAYWVASASDYIFASALSDVGGIGVTMSYVDESKVNELGGYTYNQISSGKFKDSGDPQKALTDEEKAMFQRDIDLAHDIFVNTVATNRDLDVEKVKMLADGSSTMGEQAKGNGLIDAVGDYYDVLGYIKGKYGVEPVVCW